MSGTTKGGYLTAERNKELYGQDYYRRIGSLGGQRSRTGGFYWMKQNGQVDKIKAAGRKGGSKSKRGPQRDRNL